MVISYWLKDLTWTTASHITVTGCRPYKRRGKQGCSCGHVLLYSTSRPVNSKCTNYLGGLQQLLELTHSFIRVLELLSSVLQLLLKKHTCRTCTRKGRSSGTSVIRVSH